MTVIQKSPKAAKERATWRKAWDFIFSCAGMTIGLGNVWRFPYLCYQNGGGAFLIPYLLSASLLGFPLLLLEISVGQSVRKGLVDVWGKIPLLKGIAFTNGIVLFYGTTTYSVIFAWILKYLVSSFYAVLPWTTCDNPWNTEHCVSYNMIPKNMSLMPINDQNASWRNQSDAMLLLQASANYSSKQVSASEEFLKFGVWRLSSGIEVAGSFRWELLLYSAAVWVLVYFAIFRGISWSAKIVYVTATLPIFLLIVVIVRGATLDGASDGIRYYLTPDINKLKNPEVWINAATQVLYSYVISMGALVTLGSFNRSNHNFYRDTVIIICTNAMTSFMSGFAVFSVLGFMTKMQNSTFEEVVQSGPGLVFVVYPQALSLLPFAQFWNVIFFLMLLFLGFDSLVNLYTINPIDFVDVNTSHNNTYSFPQPVSSRMCLGVGSISSESGSTLHCCFLGEGTLQQLPLYPSVTFR